MTEQEKTQLAERIQDSLLQVTLTWGQCNIIDRLVALAQGMDDFGEYRADLTAITHAITDAMVSDIETGLL